MELNAEFADSRHPFAGVLAISVVALLLILPGESRAKLHDKGYFRLSLGGSLSHTYNYDKNNYHYDYYYEESSDQYVLKDSYSGDQVDYEEIKTTLSLSIGYLLADQIELGISGSALANAYSGDADRSDLEIYDGLLYLTYYFDNDSCITPYLEIQSGASYFESGEYQKVEAVAGCSAGVELNGIGSSVWYIEYSSQFTFNNGDLMGEEWRNRLYVGISYYSDFFKKE